MNIHDDEDDDDDDEDDIDNDAEHDNDNGAHRYAYKVRHFNSLCRCLRSNDPDVTGVHGGHDPGENRFVEAPVGYGRRLGQALQWNTNVAVLRIDITTFLDPTAAVTQTSQIHQDAEPFLQYIRNSPILRSLDVHLPRTGADNTHQRELFLLELILDSLCNSSCIEELNLKTNGCLPPLDPFMKLMQSTKSISTMTLNWPVRDAVDPTATRMIGTALQSNCNLQKLTLIWGDMDGTAQYSTLLVSTFVALGRLPIFRELFLSFEIPGQKNLCVYVYEALQTFLQSTLSLHHLCLYDCGGFEDEGLMEYLIHGLSTNNTIDKLTWGCDCCEADAQRFIEFMQSPHANNILELNFGFEYAHAEFEGVSCGEVVSQILSTGNSPLRILRFDGYEYKLDHVFNLIDTSQAPNRLRTIEIHWLLNRNWTKLCKCLPKSCIQELILPRFDDSYQASQLVEALRCNGTIQSLSFRPGSFRTHYGFNDIDERRVRAYSQRNVGIPTLLSGSVELLPTLFFSTRPCWKTCPTTVVGALKIAGDFIGPTAGAKRMSG